MIAIIGGTGVESWPGLTSLETVDLQTPYGKPSGYLTRGCLGELEVIFLARHGKPHRVPPHKINYRANIWALHHLGVKDVVAIAAVGGVSSNLEAGDIVVPHQIIDYTYSRAHTFFEDDLSDVVHIDFSEPYSETIRQCLINEVKAEGHNVIAQGVYGATQGPRLETAAEIERMERDGATIVGMTGMPEASLARELGMNYGTIALVVNKAAGKHIGEITMDDIRAVLKKGMNRVTLSVSRAIASLNNSQV
jgi:5'-deoxy-5'-methylthioadenosine phosphorylase